MDGGDGLREPDTCGYHLQGPLQGPHAMPYWWDIIGLFVMSDTHAIHLVGNDADDKYYFGRR